MKAHLAIVPLVALVSLVSLVRFGMRRDEVVFEIPFEVRAFGVRVECAADAVRGGGVELRDLRLFVHDVQLVDAGGSEVSAPLVADGTFMTDDVALLDFENGRGSCAGGTSRMSAVLRVRAPRGDYRGVRFRVGVPFAANHANPATAHAPLDAGTMHWGWRAGYEFVRFEAVHAGRTSRFHLGSTGCEGTFSNITRCEREDRPRVSLDGFREGRTVVVALDRFLANADDAICMSAPGDPACPAYFAALGLDPVRGTATASAGLFAWGSP